MEVEVNCKVSPDTLKLECIGTGALGVELCHRDEVVRMVLTQADATRLRDWLNQWLERQDGKEG